MANLKNKVCLIVHDGWGIALQPGIEGNAIENSTTTNMDAIAKNHSFTTLSASGTSVGLSEGLMGNSEVGHLNIGAGRVVWQDIVRIDVSIKKRTFHKNETILTACKRAKEGNGRLHLLGLVSDGGVHSHINHLFALLETAKEQGVPHTYIHFLGDGRDTAPRSATIYLHDLDTFTKTLGYGELATIVGRYYAMDRDKRWERVKIAVDALIRGDGDRITVAADQSAAQAAVAAVEESYKADVTDEFLKPIVVNGDEGRVKEGDTLFTFNYRSDRMRELVTVLGGVEKDLIEGLELPSGLEISTMSQYKKEFPFKVAFPPQKMTNVLAEWLSKKGVKQAHVAETEKYAHVTFFFNGGLEKQFEGEQRYMVPSPKVATYDLQPGMNAHGVAEKVKELLEQGTDEFVMCNFAPPDMVGHTGIYDAAVKAIAATDEAVGTIYEAAEKNGYILLITADHGNAEQMRNAETGAPHTAHTTNPVPFIMSGDRGVLRFAEEEPVGKMGALLPKAEKGTTENKTTKEKEGEEEPPALCDVAPTILDILGIEKPEDMTGRSLLAK